MTLPSVSNLAGKAASYTKPRPTTGADTVGASAGRAAVSGGFSGFMSTQIPGAALGAALGGAAGIKAGEKTESLLAAAATGFGVGAASTAAATVGLAAAMGVLQGAMPVFSLSGLGILSVAGGLAGVSGTMQGSCLGDVKDAGTAGMLLGATAAAMGGNPLLTIAGSLAGSAGAMVQNRPLRVLVGAGTGAALGAASGMLLGPAGPVITGLMGAITGGLSAAVGPTMGQVQRNLGEDLQKAVTRRLAPMTKGVGTGGRTAIAALGGAISSLPMALIGSALFGPAGAVIPVVAGAALTGFQVHRTLKKLEKAEPYIPVVKAHLAKFNPPEQVEAIAPRVLSGLAVWFAERYGTPEALQAISPEQFSQDLAELQGAA